ncbi:MAG: CDP-glucose 4,6-dehydratase [Bdellovibrionales bacterium]|nr:CDP-glucose 4,6-dehydratase [Bdellovibrionales bacterium]
MESVVVNSNFWKGKRVFLTGHTGFKGAWLAFWLHSMGAKVTGVALAPSTEPNLFSILGLESKIDSYFLDIRNYEELSALLQKSEPEIVLHLAAQALVRDSYQDPLGTYSTNIMGTAHVLEALRQTPSVRSGLIVTTDKCYENKEWVYGYRETDPMGGYDPYSSSKGCAELVTASYRSSYFNPEDHSSHKVGIASARAGNVIGGGDWSKDRLVPDIVSAITKKVPLHIRSPHSTRPWQHVLTPLSGYLILSEQLYNNGDQFSEAYNFGPDDDATVTVGDMTQRFGEVWGDMSNIVIEKAPQPHEAGLLKLDSSKAKAKLKWSPRWGFQETIEKTVEWYRTYYENSSDIVHLTERQLLEFQQG